MIENWTSAYSVHIDKIDKQHQHLFSLVALLEEAVMHNRGGDVFDRILDEMRRYTSYHFLTEERLMELYEYPDLDSHRLSHERFIEKVMEFDFYPDSTEKHSEEALNFLSSWIQNHIKTEDLKFGDFCLEKGFVNPDIPMRKNNTD
jgi:hemerythrin